MKVSFYNRNILFLFTVYLLTSQLIHANEICIKNFQKQICKDFKLLNSVIVKSSLAKNILQEKLNLSNEIKQIAFLENSNLYLIDSNKPLEYSKELIKKSYIIYAQPSISQIKNNHFKSSQDITKKFNLKKIWKTTKGQGVNVAIIDDGFNLKHEDLNGVNVIFSYDADNKNLDASSKLDIDTHGTQVAGIIFAQHNNIGIDGIAPLANLIAIRQTTNITSDTVLSFTVAQKAGADIINCSWNSPILLEPVYDVIKHLSKDIVIVFAAGNAHKELQPYSTEASIDEVITVGAKQKYSNYGNLVDFVVPSNIKTTKSDGSYTTFGGTSASAPVLSGLLALKMSYKNNKTNDELIQKLKGEIDEN